MIFLVLFLNSLISIDESFFKIKGGIEYMYYFIDIRVGNPG